MARETVSAKSIKERSSCSSALLCSVMSSPELSVAVILPSSSLKTALCQAISLSLPLLVRTGFSKYSTGSISPAINLAEAAFTSSLIPSGTKLSCQSLFNISSSLCPNTSQPFWFISLTFLSESITTIIVLAKLRYFCALSRSFRHCSPALLRSATSLAMPRVPTIFPSFLITVVVISSGTNSPLLVLSSTSKTLILPLSTFWKTPDKRRFSFLARRLVKCFPISSSLL